jgi:hypothetical protein
MADLFRIWGRKRRVRAAISGMLRFRRQYHKARKMDATRRDLIMQRWNVVQHELIPGLKSVVSG